MAMKPIPGGVFTLAGMVLSASACAWPGPQPGCETEAAARTISSVVLSVHDGDTLTVTEGGRTVNVRLEGIDAPELSQPYGAQSREALARLVAQQPVTVSYSKTDRYGRVIGRVHTRDCTDVNLRQLASGMAWFYAAFQCELPGSARRQYRTTQEAARSERVGLWAQEQPEAPWMRRNGRHPATPACRD